MLRSSSSDSSKVLELQFIRLMTDSPNMLLLMVPPRSESLSGDLGVFFSEPLPGLLARTICSMGGGLGILWTGCERSMK